MLGLDLRLSRLLNNGKIVIIAIDHGLFDGPISGMEKVKNLPDKIYQGVDGVLLSPGTLKIIGKSIFAQKESPYCITRINWATTYCFSWKYNKGETVKLYTPLDAFKLGADCVLISLTLKTGSEQKDAENVKIFTDLCIQTHDLGIPVIGEYFPRDYSALSPEELRDEIRIACRILAELGADMIKTFHTIDFEKTVEGCPVPILTLGGEKYPKEIDALKSAEAQIKDGAGGVVFGRNAIQAENPIAFQKALIDIVRKNIPAEQAAQNYDI